MRGLMSRAANAKSHYCNLGASKYFLDIAGVVEISNRTRR
jgi:hypothetical protein